MAQRATATVEASSAAVTTTAKVLSVGLACVDFINVVAKFPLEDSDQRGEKYYWQRGGNASNMSTVLTLLSTPCDFMGVMGTRGAEASWIREDFEKEKISLERCVYMDVQCPVSTSILSLDKGTRTIFYYPRDQPCLSFEDFDSKLHGDFSSYSWVHFELTENTSDVSMMMDSVLLHQSCSYKPTLSVEIEKPELEDAESIMGKADVVFLGKDFAKSRGFVDGAAAVKGLYSFCKPGSILVCAWGDQGAYACLSSVTQSTESHGCVVHSAALRDITVVDSLGAGDTFVAGMIHSLLAKLDMPDTVEGRANLVQEALAFACRVAGLKCSIYGYAGIRALL